MDVLLALNQEQQLTFILVTHDRGIGARCGRTVRMRNGLVETDQSNSGPDTQGTQGAQGA
jgi:putative ABC transport system ATP-binding protein